MSAIPPKADIATKLLTKDDVADRGEYREVAGAIKPYLYRSQKASQTLPTLDFEAGSTPLHL
jgi:hypothetical protein